MNQELVLGQGLPPEREISEKLGVSRNSVREALKILTVMGVVSSRQGAGNYISGNFKGYMVDALSMMFMLDKLDYDQINQIRIGLEMQAYALAVKNAETKDIIELQKRKGMLQEAHKQIVEYLLKRDVVNGQKALMKHFEMIDNIIHKEL